MERSPEFYQQQEEYPKGEKKGEQEKEPPRKEGDVDIPAAAESAKPDKRSLHEKLMEIRALEEQLLFFRTVTHLLDSTTRLSAAFAAYERLRSKGFTRKLAGGFREVSERGKASETLKQILAETEDEIERNKPILMRALKTEENVQSALFIASAIFGLSGYRPAQELVVWAKVLFRDLRGIVTEKVAAFGVDSDSMIRAWKESGKNRDLPSIVEKNLKVMAQLETSRPGITRTLAEKFKIRDFARYPVELLIAQYDERDNANIPYGVVFYPVHDWNGAFYEGVDVLQKLFRNLKEARYGIRVVEIGSKIDAARALIGLDRRYGKFNKINFAIIGGHGALDSIQFGSSIQFLRERSIEKGATTPKMSRLDREDIKGKGIRRVVKEFFEPNPSFILISCSTGALKGIGQELSRLGVEVIAPATPTNVKSIEVARGTEGELHFDVEYSQKKKEKTIARRYVYGQKLE